MVMGSTIDVAICGTRTTTMPGPGPSGLPVQCTVLVPGTCTGTSTMYLVLDTEYYGSSGSNTVLFSTHIDISYILTKLFNDEVVRSAASSSAGFPRTNL